MGYGLATEGWVLYVIICFNLLGGVAQASMQSIISNAADAKHQGSTMGAVSSLNSLMAVLAPVASLELLRWVSRPGRLDLDRLPFFVSAALMGVATLIRCVFPQPSRASRGPVPHEARQSPHPRFRLPGHPAHRPARAWRPSIADPPQRRLGRLHPAASSPRPSSSAAATPPPTGPRTARPQTVWDAGVPVLGICYGMQTMAVQLGGKVEVERPPRVWLRRGARHGHQVARRYQDFGTAEGHGMLKVWMSHGDKVTALPPGFKLMASTPSCPIAGMANEDKGYYAVQFHPEVTHTLQGQAMLTRFVRGSPAAGRLDHGRLHRGSGRPHPRAGGQRGSHPGPFRWRRFLGRGGADPPRHRRPADLRVR